MSSDWSSGFDPLALYDPLPVMDELHRSQARKRMLLKPNQMGGTYAWCAEVWWGLTDTHPYRPPLPTGGPVWLVITDLGGEYRVICEKLHALEPSGALHPGCKYIPGAGYRYRGTQQIVMANDRIAEWRAGTQDPLACESGTVVGLFINEPPNQRQWGGLMQRISTYDAPVFMNFTAVGRDLGWLKTEIHGNPEEAIPPRDPTWDVRVGELTQAACTTISGRVIRTEASIREQMLLCPPDEYNQRIRAGWDMATVDRVLTGYSDATLLEQVPAARREAGWDVLLGMDHGELAGHEVALLMLWDPTWPLLVILDEYTNPTTSDIDADADGIRAMLGTHGLLPRQIDRAVGDINSAGKLAAGRTINDMLGEALGIYIHTPVKGQGSVGSGVAHLNQALRRVQIRIHPRCRGLLRAVKHWRGGDDDLKHYIDALRYGAQDALEDLNSIPQPKILI